MPVVKFIVNARRAAGYGSAPIPPSKLIGKRVTIRRALIGWHGYWCSFKKEKFVFSHAELGLDDCNCQDCLEVKKRSFLEKKPSRKKPSDGGEDR